MEILRVSGTPAELREAGILDLITQATGGGARNGGEDAPDGGEIARFITRARNEFRPHVRAFLDEILRWDGTRIGTLIPRYARIETGPRDTLVYIVPRRPTADIYLDWDDSIQVAHGRTIAAHGWTPKIVQVRLDTEQAVEEALHFARQAYEAQRVA